jgi:NADH:ubiquinone oxidoreductase subunit
MHKTTSLFTFQNKSLHGRLSKKLRENEFQNSEFDDGNDGNNKRERGNQLFRLS